MRRLLWLLALCALAVGISLAARFNQRYILLVLPPYRAEISLNLAIVLLALTFVLLYGLFRAAALTVSLPNRVRSFRERRRCEKAAVAFQDAMRLLFKGRFGQVLKRAGEAARRQPCAGSGGAARGTRRTAPGRGGDGKAWLERASRDDLRMEPARLMLEAETHLDGRNFEAAAKTLQRLQALSGRHIAALRLELRAQQGCANWPEVAAPGAPAREARWCGTATGAGNQAQGPSGECSPPTGRSRTTSRVSAAIAGNGEQPTTGNTIGRGLDRTRRS